MKTGKFGRYFMAMLLTGSLLTACSPEIDVRTSPDESDLAVEAPSTIDPLPPKIQQTNLVQKQPIPDWVNIGPLPEFPEESLDLIKNGIAYIAEEDRVYVSDTGYKFFSRLAYKVTERKGLETAAQIRHTFDPELGSLAYNFIRVTRNGKTVDRLGDLTIQELQREDGLSDGLVDGDITALINLEDIRVGDIIDYGYFSEYQAPLWPGHFFNNVSISYGVPLALQTYEISVPETTVLNIEAINTKLRPHISKNNGRSIYKYEIKNAPVEKKVSNVPADIISDPYLLLSTMQSWEEVSLWGTHVYDIDMSLPSDYSGIIKKLKKASKTPEGRMVAALQHVQNNIRYLGIESGVNSHKPRIPSVTFSKGYGDCKDKTVLLIATLEKLGISAYPALVSTSSGSVLPQLLPSINNFNHVIVMAELDGKTYWLDPTLTYQQGTAETLTIPDYGYALPLKVNQTELTKIEVEPPSDPTTHVKEIYRLEEEGSMSLNVETVYRDSSADHMRRNIIKNGLEATSKSYLNYYADLYPGLMIDGKMYTADDVDLNEFTIHEAYKLSTEDYEKNEIGDKLYIKASTLEGQLPTSLEADRVIKLGLSKDTFLRHTMHVETPGRQFIAPEDTVTEVSGVTFSRVYDSEDNTLKVDYSLKIEEGSVPLADARGIIELAEKIGNDIELNVFPKAATQKLSMRLGLKGDVPEEIETELGAISELIMKKESVKAMERLNVLEADYTKSDPLRGYIQFYRGAVFIDLKRNKQAMAAFDEAFSLYDPDKSDIYFRYASLLNSDEQYVEATKITQRLLSKFPETIKQVNYKWLWRLYGEVFRAGELAVYDDAMIATAKAQLKYVDDIDETDQAFESAIPIFVRRDETEAAKPFLDYLKDPATMRNLLIDKKMAKVWPHVTELAGSDLSIAIENYVKHSAESALKEGSDFNAKNQYLVALYKAGKYDKAKSYGAKTLENWSKIDAVGMDAYWFVGAYASLLADMGERDEAHKTLEKLLKDRLADSPGLVSLAINHVSMLVWEGQFDKAIKLVEVYESDDDFQASDYGWQFLHQARACAMFELGETEKAFELYAEKSKDSASENIRSHFLAMVCMNKIDEAAELLKERLENDIYRETALPIFSTTNPPKYPNAYEDKIMARIKTIAGRPDVMKVFEKYGRPIHINGYSDYWSEY